MDYQTGYIISRVTGDWSQSKSLGTREDSPQNFDGS